MQQADSETSVFSPWYNLREMKKHHHIIYLSPCRVNQNLFFCKERQLSRRASKIVAQNHHKTINSSFVFSLTGVVLHKSDQDSTLTWSDTVGIIALWNSIDLNSVWSADHLWSPSLSVNGSLSTRYGCPSPTSHHSHGDIPVNLIPSMVSHYNSWSLDGQCKKGTGQERVNRRNKPT